MNERKKAITSTEKTMTLENGQIELIAKFFFKYFFGVPHLATCIFLFFYNEPELGVGIDPGMALTPLPSSIGRGSNPRPSDREPNSSETKFATVF